MRGFNALYGLLHNKKRRRAHPAAGDAPIMRSPSQHHRVRGVLVRIPYGALYLLLPRSYTLMNSEISPHIIELFVNKRPNTMHIQNK